MDLLTKITNAFMLIYIGFAGAVFAWLEYALFIQRKWSYFSVMTVGSILFGIYVHWAWSNSVFTLAGQKKKK